MRNNKKEQIKMVVKWMLIALVIILSATINTTGKANGARPLLLIPVVVCISMSQSEIVSGIIGAVCGLLMDITCGTLVGVNAVVMLVIGVTISLLCLHLIKNNLVDAVLLTAAACMIQGFINFFFNYAIWGVSNYFSVLLKILIPSCLFTVICSPVAYFVIRIIMSKLAKEERITVDENSNI